MKRFLIGFAIGLIVGGTSVGVSIKEYAKKHATIENAEKIADITKSTASGLKDVLD